MKFLLATMQTCDKVLPEMANKSHKRGKKLGGKIVFRGIGEDARTLKISAPYLWQCLTGRKNRQEIVDRYWKLKRDQARQFLNEAPKAA